MTKLSAKEKRRQGLGEVFAKFVDSDGKWVKDVPVDQIVAAIETLRPLGRTVRWQKVLTRWQRMVEASQLYEDAATREGFMFVHFLQGQIYANFEA